VTAREETPAPEDDDEWTVVIKGRRYRRTVPLSTIQAWQASLVADKPKPPSPPFDWKPPTGAVEWIEANCPRVNVTHVTGKYVAWCAEHGKEPSGGGLINSATRDQERLDNGAPLVAAGRFNNQDPTTWGAQW
jgi:hypothetical protein